MDHNALIYQRNFFLPTAKSRLADPSENCALDFKRESRRYAISSVSATIDIDRPIFDICNPRTTIRITALATREVQHGDGVSRAVAG
jgi:hypothetical protein